MFNGKKLATQRKLHNLSQEQLAYKLNVSLSSIAMYETNKRQPDNETIKNISQLFGVTTDYLLDNELNPETMVLEEENKQVVQAVIDGLSNPLNKVLYSKASELKSDKDRQIVLNVINSFIEEVDNKD